MIRTDEYASYDALGLKALLDAGEVSAIELHQVAQHAIESLNPTLNFLISDSTEDADRALSNLNMQAPFAGIPFLMKEGVGMTGQPAYLGCRLGKGLYCKADSEFVRRLKNTGIITLGSTNTPEFGSSPTTESLAHGPARNPWNIEHSTGGSSGGGSAAVAAGIVPIAQTSDGGGSIRTPAHCCGVFGFMPSRGRNPIGPNTFGGTFGIARNHVTSRTVRDSAAMLDQLHGSEPGALHRIELPSRPFLKEVGANPGHLRIAFSTTAPSGQPVDSECVAGVMKATKLCHDLGHRVEEAEPDYDWDLFFRAATDHWSLLILAGIDRLEADTGKQAGPDTLEWSSLAIRDQARSLSPERINTSFMNLYRIGRDIECFFDHWDVLITPVCTTPAPRLGTLNGNQENLTAEQWFGRCTSQFAPFPPVFNCSGQPSMSVPLHHSAEGLPVGVMCTARVGDEATLFRLAAQFEQACPWINRHPPVGLFNNG